MRYASHHEVCAAQNVESSQCMTLISAANDGSDLHISCTMPSIEVRTEAAPHGSSRVIVWIFVTLTHCILLHVYY